jgi:uncharacterized protein YkwD
MVGKMESIVFGQARPRDPIEKRLGELEQATFKAQYPNQTLFERTQHLKATILGVDDTATSDLVPPSLDTLMRPAPRESSTISFLEEIANRPENEVAVGEEQIQLFALELVNYLRSEMGQAPFVSDPVASKVAKEQAVDLARRNLVSHANTSGENPDLRYTKDGGTDAITESVASLRELPSGKKMTRANIARLMKILLDREDDREAVLSPDATALGFASAFMSETPALIGCLEIVTRHGAIEPVSGPITIGEKVEIKGSLEGTYHFDKISIAWEGQNGAMVSASDESQEALPYFPPLDYIAYAAHAEHDYEKAVTTLRTIGLIAAIAGGVFMPPVALAAPLIAVAGSTSEPKPLSDIPVKGGVKTDGSYFSVKLPLSKEGKDGIYYVTVWAANPRSGKAVPVSRRAFIVSAGAHPSEDYSANKSAKDHQTSQNKHSDKAEL